MTQAIVDRLLTQDDVVDVAAGACVLIQRRGDCGARLAAYCAIGFAEPDQRLVQRRSPPVEVDPNAGAQLFEQAVPCGVADWAEVGEDPLFRFRQLVRSELWRLFDRVAIASRLRGGVKARGLVVADVRQLQREEDAMTSPFGAGLAHARQEP